MKINTNSTGNIVIRDQNDAVLHVVSDDVFLHQHTTRENILLITKEASKNKAKDAIWIDFSLVREVEGNPFSGTRNDLLELLSTLFKRTTGSVSTEAKQDQNIAKLEELNNKLQALLDKPDYETIYRIGFDSESLKNEVFGAITTTEFGQGSGTHPTLTILNDSSFSWTTYDRKHWVVAPINFNFSSTPKVNVYFKLKNIGDTLESNRLGLYLQHEQSPNNWVSVVSKISHVGVGDEEYELIHLCYDNQSLQIDEFRLVIQEHGENNDAVFPSTYQIELLGITDSNTNYITEYQHLENNVVALREYQDAFNQPYTLVGDFVMDTTARAGATTEKYLINLIELLREDRRQDLEKIKAANDYQEVISYLDQGSSIDRRIHTIVYSSNALGLSVTETYSYSGSAGNYYLSSKTRS